MRRLLSVFMVAGVVAAGTPAVAASADAMAHAHYARHGVRSVAAGVHATLTRAGNLSAPPRSWVQTQNLRAPDAARHSDFGVTAALSADGRFAIVGALGVNLSQGAAYVYVRQRNGWRLQQDLRAADGAASDEFGSAVALSANGRVAVIGAADQNARIGATHTGATYVFVRTGRLWHQQQKLPTPAKAWSFGNAVALSGTGDVLLVGSWFANGGASNGTGAAYLFIRKQGRWRPQQELDASDAAPSDGFGTSVALSTDGRTAVVGTPYPNGGTGATYLFSQHGSGWRQDQKLTVPSATANRFGQSLGMSANGRVVLIGAPGELGAAYLFARNGSTWKQTQTLQPSARLGQPFMFGYSVALSGRGHIALIGAIIAPGLASGAAYVFTASHGRWQQTQTMKPAPAGPGRNNFGGGVALATRGHIALIGAPLTNNDTGAAYVFTNPRPPQW